MSNEGRLDTRHSQETPEGVALTLTPAGPIARALAWALDLSIRGVIYAVLGGALAPLGGGGAGMLLIAAFLLEWFYPVFFELRGGATPGKQALSLVVVRSDGSAPDLGASLLRNLVRFVDFMPVGYLFGLISCLCSARFQRLGDLAAGTLVVHARKPPRRALPLEVRPAPPRVALTQEEQGAIVEFAQRASHWTAQRQAEIASHSGACTRGSETERVQQLLAQARWIAGER